MQVQINKK